MVILICLLNCLIIGGLASNWRIRRAISGSRRRDRTIIVHFLRLFNGRVLLTRKVSNGAQPDCSLSSEHIVFQVSSFLVCALQVFRVQRGSIAISRDHSMARPALTRFPGNSPLLIFPCPPNGQFDFRALHAGVPEQLRVRRSYS